MLILSLLEGAINRGLHLDAGKDTLLKEFNQRFLPP